LPRGAARMKYELRRMKRGRCLTLLADLINQERDGAET
jgi:hypothetical protein